MTTRDPSTPDSASHDATGTVPPAPVSRCAAHAVVAPEARKAERFRRVARSTLAFGLVGVVLFLLLFAFYQRWLLAGLAALSLPAYLLAYRLVGRGRVALPLAIGATVLVVDAVMDTLVLGVGSGFLVYLPVLSMVLFMHPRARLRHKVALGGALVAVPLALIAVVRWIRPLSPASPALTGALAILNAVLVIALLAFLAHVIIQAADAAERELRVALDRLHKVARTDVLTGLLNRRAMEESLASEAGRADRRGSGFAVVLADIDDFKRINDRHGHAVGDAALRGVAERLLASVRVEDRLARWGGEEFLVLLPDTGLEAAAVAADRLRTAVATASFEAGGRRLGVTATFGVAFYAPRGNLDAVVRAADRALYRGKAAGKERVISAAP